MGGHQEEETLSVNLTAEEASKERLLDYLCFISGYSRSQMDDIFRMNDPKVLRSLMN